MTTATKLATQPAMVGLASWVATGTGNAIGGYLAGNVTDPDTLLILCHGCCYAEGTPATALLTGGGSTGGALATSMGQMASDLADAHPNLLVFAPDYECDLGGQDGWWNAVHNGIQNVQDITAFLQSAHGTITKTIAWGMSMGGLISGMAVAGSPSRFQYWVSSYGVMALNESWVRVTELGQVHITADMGGATPITNMALYHQKSPLYNCASYATLNRVYAFCGSDDVTVPVNQAIEMQQALRAANCKQTLVTAPHAIHGAEGALRTRFLIIDPLIESNVEPLTGNGKQWAQYEDASPGDATWDLTHPVLIH